MSGSKILAALLLSASMLAASATQAMPIQVFDRMSDRDQDDYVALVLLKGAKQVLTDAGRPDQAAQVERLFTTREPGDENTLGMVELELNLSAVRQTDAGNLVKDPSAKPLPVEFAMIGTLKKNGIILPKTFMHVGDDFQSRDSLSPPPAFGPFSQCFAYRHGACVGDSHTAPPVASHPAPADDDPFGPGGFITPPQR